MKKLISMMLMLCAIITFSACSSSDEENTPANPVSGVVVPSSAKIGSEVTLQGKGFANGQTLWLRNPSDRADFVQLKPTFTSNGATFTIPYDSKEGTYQLVLDSSDNEWVLGTITLQAADCPVTSPTIPMEVALKSTEVTIWGMGFAQGDVIAVVPVDFAQESKNELPTTLTDNGVKVDFSNITNEDDYNVYLKRGNSTWLLGQTYIYQPRQIASITISDNQLLSMIGIPTDGTLTLNFEYNADGTLHAITSNSNVLPGWEFTYNGNTVTTTDVNGRPLTYTLNDAGRMVSSTGYDTSGEEVKYNWNYFVGESSLWCVVKEGTDQTDDDAFVRSVAQGNMDSYKLSLKNEFTPNTSLHACPGTVDPTYLLNTAWWLLVSRDDLFIGLFLPKTTDTSLYVPATIAAEEDEKGGTTKMGNPFTIESSFEDNTLTMKTVGGAISEGQGLYTGTVVVKYKNK